jgi:Putative outer membrane beta-barrel porin, MtrB/PioB
MKSAISTFSLVAALASPALAQDAPDFTEGSVTFGFQQRDVDTASSKFFEYRDLPDGGIAPDFAFKGKKGAYRYTFFGQDVTQKDQRYHGRFEGQTWAFKADYTGIPHAFGNDGKSILNIVEPNVWRLSDTLQSAWQADLIANRPRVSYAYLYNLVAPTLDEHPADVDVALQRGRTSLSFSLVPGGGNLDVGVTYFHEKRSGARTNNGTAFGFGNVVETWDPIRYVTQDFGVTGSLKGGWGTASVGFNYNDFTDRYDTFLFDNPFRITDSTHPSAYQAPSTATVDGPAHGLASTPPSNSAWTVKGGTTLTFGPKTRLTADAQVGRWTQNEQPFIPFTTNTSITLPDGRDATSTAALPAQHLDGKIEVFALNGFLTTGVGDNLRLNARYRLYKNDNKTPRIRFEEGYTRYDAVWEEIPRITVPNGFESNYLDVYATYDLGTALGVEAGWKLNSVDRTFRETESTTENTLRVAVDVRAGGGLTARGVYEFGTRDFDDYLPVQAEEHSFLEEGPPANHTALRRYDQAKRDRNRLGVQAQWSPGSGKLTVGAAYFWNKDEYDDSPVACNADYHAGDVGDAATYCTGGTTAPLGLMEAKYETFSLDADFSPGEKVNVYAFYSREDVFDYQTGTQSGAAITFDPRWAWTSTVDDKVDSFGAGADFTLVPDRWFLGVLYRFQKVDGRNGFTAGPLARPATTGPVQDIGVYDDTEINHLSGTLKWRFATAWAATLGGWWEKYIYEDEQTGQTLYYMPASFFLNPVNGSYDGWTGYVSLTYRF